MAERYVSFRIGKETSLGSEVVPTENKNPFTDGTLIFAYNDKYNHNDASAQIVDGRLYVDATIDSSNYRFPVNSECSYFLINSEDGKDFEMGNTGRPVYFSGGIPQPVDYVSTAYGGTGLTSFNANRMVWTASTSALSTSGHYVDADHFAVNSETLPSYNFYVSGTSGFSGGHLYLTGAQGSSSVNNTTQIVFGTPSNNHVAVSSNTNALIINPSTSETDNQIVLYLNQQSRFPNGITCGDDDTVGSINTNGDIIAAGGLNVGGATALGGNLSVTGTTAMQGNITITNGNPYVKLVDTANSNQVYYIQGYQGKFAFGPTFASAIQTDASGNMTLPSGATITPRADNTGSIGSSSYEWSQGFFRNIQSEDTFNLSAASNISFSSTTGIIQFNQSGAESGRFNGSGELQLITAVRPAARGSATSGSADYAWGATYTNNLCIQDAANNYNGGQFYTTSSTSTTSQPTYLIIGNATSNGTAGSRYGLIRLYASTNEYTDIRARSNPAYNKSVFYLPAGEAASDSCYAVWNPNSATAVGGSGQPVYVDATGKVVGITTLTSGYGGTGVASHTANRLVWSTSATTIQATDNHFVNAEKLAINYTSEPDYNFYVNGTSGFTDDIRVFNEGNIIYKINRKTSDGGGWAYSPFSIVGNDNVMFANIGVYGGADSMTYMYIGSGNYNATTNVRITPTGSLSIPGDQTITPQTDATGSVGTSSYEWNEGYFRSIKSGSTLYITPSSTLYLDSASGASLIFRPQGTEQARFNTSGQLQIKSTGAANATVIGPETAGTFYFPNTGGTFVTHATRGTAVGGTNRPVYIASTGRATAITATAIAYGGTGATTTAGARTNLHYSAATITTTTNDTVANWGAKGPLSIDWYSTAGQITDQPGQYGFVMNISKGTASELHQLWFGQPSGDIYHRGGNASGWSGTWKKLLDTNNYASVLNDIYVNVTGDTMTGDLVINGNLTTNTAYTRDLYVKANSGARYNHILFLTHAGTLYGHIYCDCGSTSSISRSRITFREYSANSTANTTTTGYYEDYHLPESTDGLTASKSYEIFTSKSYTTLDGRYVNVSGDTMTGDLTITKTGARFIANNTSRSVWFGSSVNGNYQGIYDATAGYYLIRNTDSSHASNGVYLGATTTVAGSVTLSGQVYRGGTSTSWINGRAGALVRTSTISGYSATVSVKTTNGSWEIGAYDNSSYTDRLLFSYCTDANYSAGTNATTAQVYITSGGMFSCAVLKSSNYGTGAPGSSTAGYGTNGALYFKVIS